MTTFVQWKNTDICMDFNCPSCGGESHIDAMFAYVVRCPDCGKYFKMPTDLPLEEVSSPGEMPFVEGGG